MRRKIETLQQSMVRNLWLAVGMIALIIGVVGVVMPVLPTTPFVILAAFAFGRSSPKLSSLLEAHHVFGQIIKDWRAEGAIARRYKIMAAGMMAATFTLSYLLGASRLILFIQAGCMLPALYYILTRPNGKR